MQGGSLPLRTSRIRTDDDTVFNIAVLTDPPQRTRFRVKVVHGDVEEALNLTGMEIHSDDVIATGSLKHVCHEFRCDRRA